MIEALIEENIALKEALFVIGEIAVVNFNDFIVGIVDETIKDFKIPEKRFKDLVQEYQRLMEESNGKRKCKKTNHDKG